VPGFKTEFDKVKAFAIEYVHPAPKATDKKK
jgi:hypothetical protein